jgi:hypothetical protein
MKMAVFWVVAPCSLVEAYNVSEVLAASIIRAMTELIALMIQADKIHTENCWSRTQPICT